MACRDTRTDLLDDAEAGSDFVGQLDLRDEIVGWQSRKHNCSHRQPRPLAEHALVCTARVGSAPPGRAGTVRWMLSLAETASSTALAPLPRDSSGTLAPPTESAPLIKRH